jgi:hypothetical protein
MEGGTTSSYLHPSQYMLGRATTIASQDITKKAIKY